MSCCVKSSVLRRLAWTERSEKHAHKGMWTAFTPWHCFNQSQMQLQSENTSDLLKQQWTLALSKTCRIWGSEGLWLRNPKISLEVWGLHVRMWACVHVCMLSLWWVHAPGCFSPYFVGDMLHEEKSPASHGVKSLVLCFSQPMISQIYSLSCREQLHGQEFTSIEFQDAFQTSHFSPNSCKNNQTRLVQSKYYYFFCLIIQMRGYFCNPEVQPHQCSYGNNNLERWRVLKDRIMVCEQQAAHLWKLLHHNERKPTQLQIADELIFSWGTAPVSGLHAGLTENVEQISQLILVQQAFLLCN